MPLPRPSLSSQQKASPLLAPITPAEERVLTLLRRGDSNRAIAERLVLSPRTVESHVSRLLAKTGCRNRTQLTLWSQAHA